MNTRNFLKAAPLMGLIALSCGGGSGTGNTGGTGGSGGAGGMGNIGGTGNSGGGGPMGGGGGVSNETPDKLEIRIGTPCPETQPAEFRTPLTYNGRAVEYEVAGFKNDKQVSMISQNVTWTSLNQDTALFVTGGESSTQVAETVGLKAQIIGLKDVATMGMTDAPKATIRACVQDVCASMELTVENDLTGKWGQTEPVIGDIYYVTMNCREIINIAGSKGGGFISGSLIVVPSVAQGQLMDNGTVIDMPYAKYVKR